MQNRNFVSILYRDVIARLAFVFGSDDRKRQASTRIVVNATEQLVSVHTRLIFPHVDTPVSLRSTHLIPVAS